MTNQQGKHFEDDFDLELYKREAIRERIQKRNTRTKLLKEKILTKIVNFLIMIIFITLGGMLYKFLSKLIHNFI